MFRRQRARRGGAARGPSSRLRSSDTAPCSGLCARRRQRLRPSGRRPGSERGREVGLQTLEHPEPVQLRHARGRGPSRSARRSLIAASAASPSAASRKRGPARRACRSTSLRTSGLVVDDEQRAATVAGARARARRAGRAWRASSGSRTGAQVAARSVPPRPRADHDGTATLGRPSRSSLHDLPPVHLAAEQEIEADERGGPGERGSAPRSPVVTPVDHAPVEPPGAAIERRPAGRP